MTAIIAAAGVVAYASDGMWGSAWGLLPLCLHAAVGYRLVRGWDLPHRVQLMLGLGVVAFAAGALTERPVTLGNLAWMIVIPMLATRLLGPRFGTRWLVVALLAQLATTLVLQADLFPTFSPTEPLWYQTMRFAIITVAVYAFAKQASLQSEELLGQVKAADEAKSVFLANISHEIRTPLNGVLGMTQALLHRDLEPSLREELQVVERSGATLLRLINDLLDLTKAERGELPLEVIPFDLERLLRDLVRFGEAMGHQRGQPVACRLEAPPTAVVLGDPTRVRQVLGNLVSNALKFTAQGEVTLRARSEEAGRWTFEVTDTGMGMSPQTLAALFKPFKQADASISRRFGGTGLGLALAKTLTEKMGGSISASSHLGQGSTFRVTLPLASTSLAPVEAEVTVPSLEGRRVLLVDDNPVNLKVAEALLTRTHCEVVTASSGEEALALAAEDPPFDVVLMDCHLPGLDGWETTRRLHALPGRAAMNVIALTASAGRDDVEHCLNAGMTGVLAKPILFRDLCRVLSPYASSSPERTSARAEWSVP